MEGGSKELLRRFRAVVEPSLWLKCEHPAISFGYTFVTF